MPSAGFRDSPGRRPCPRPRPRRRPRGLWRRRGGRRGAALLLGLGLLCGGALPAEARRYRVVKYVETAKGRLELRFSYRSFFNRRLRRELKKGFQKVILVQALVYRKGRRRPVAVAGRSYKVIYDLWAGSFLLTVDDARGTRKLRVNTLSRALEELSEVRLDIGPRGRYPRRSQAGSSAMFYADVVIQFAPLPRGFLRKIRRWLRNPLGPASKGGSPLGSRFSLFVNPRISRALKEWKFRTQQFYRP